MFHFGTHHYLINKNMNYDNRKLIVPTYKDDDAGHDGDNGIVYADAPLFPFSSPNMVYDKRLHQYSLTPHGLSSNGIVVDPSEVQVFIKNVTNAVYSYIKVASGKTNYPYMMYRIAKGWCPNMSPISARYMFLDLLLTQARYMTTQGYAKDAPKVTMTETGRTKAMDLNNTDGYWLHDDVITSLDALNLTNTQRIRNVCGVDWTLY